MQCYEICTVGEHRHIQRQQVKNLIVNIAELTHFSLPQEFPAGTMRTAQQPDKEYQAVYGEFAVYNLLEEIINDAFTYHDSNIYFFMPADYSFFFDTLFIQYSRNNQVRIKCLLEFQRTANKLEKSTTNLDALYTLIPFLSLPRNGFEAFYIYSDYPVHKTSVLVMPYYIITNNTVINLSPDLRTAVAQRNQIVTNGYLHSFLEILAHTKPLMKQCSLIDSISHYHDSCASIIRDTITYSIEPHPCFEKYFTTEIIDAHLKDSVPNRNMLLNSVAEYYRTLASAKFKNILLFSKEGFIDFTDFGVLSFLPEQYYSKFSAEERTWLIRRLLHDIREEKQETRLINQAKFRVSNSAALTVIGESSINITIRPPDNNLHYSKIIHIDEISIVDAFHDFMQSILDTDLVHTKEETINLLENALEKLNN